jgi:hypothetical protein
VSSLTYLYCIVAAPRAPRTARAPRGLPGLAAARALEIDRGLYAIVADAPRRQYDEATVNRRLSNLDWVSQIAVAHEAVVEYFVDQPAVLPSKLLTLFDDDESALKHLHDERRRLAATAKRVARHVEWGVRILLDPSSAGRANAASNPKREGAVSGAAYLALKRARLNEREELAGRAKATASTLFATLARRARAARKRSGHEPPAAQGTLLLDAAFLVPKSRAASFRSLAAKHARSLAPDGYVVTLTGPWPPYSFVQD